MGISRVVASRRARFMLAAAAVMLLASAAAVALALRGGGLFAQTGVFDSESIGADGALDLSRPDLAGRSNFDFYNDWELIRDPVIQPERPADNIYQFTSINIPAGKTLRLSGNNIPVPVYWLAQGTVQIDGVIDMDGKNGHPACDFIADTACIASRSMSEPGAGGHPGGFGGNQLSQAMDGFGPQGGGPPNSTFKNGDNTNNRFAVPLSGGSGGAGANVSNTQFIGAGGGAGGGALLIASSTSITVGLTGAINALGGTKGDGLSLCSECGFSGDGAGGMIRLAAPIIQGQGAIRAYLVRMEAFKDTCCGTPIAGFLYRSAPFDANLPANNVIQVPSVRVVNIGGAAVPPDPTGDFLTPDVEIDSQGGPVVFQLEANNIPPGTFITLRIGSEDEPGLQQTAQSTPLVGSFQESTATATATLPRGFTQIYVTASW
ncbi:MAG: hypothetical protein L0177_11485 [Chloroflexi bacterium]|nr:hypothetical protein [Chloroflexota bacterium]